MSQASFDDCRDRDDVIAELRAEISAGQPCAVCRATARPLPVQGDARRDDPGTSKRGGADVAGRVGSQRRRLLDAYATGRPMTPDEALNAAQLSPRSCYWKRVSELGHAGLLDLTGEERPGASGSMQRVYRISVLGVQALAQAVTS